VTWTVDRTPARTAPGTHHPTDRSVIFILEPVRRTIMAVDPELLEILACPNCKTPVVLVNDGTGLKCGECRRVYPIKDDIPVMLIDEATIEP
jgi:uncharacterized protein YbaR (Trm112 family)